MDGAGQKALCALRVTDLPSPPPPCPADAQVPSVGREQLQSPAAARPLAAGSSAWVRIGSRLTSSLRGPAPGTGSQLTWVLRGSAPSSRQPGLPSPGVTADSAPTLLRPGPESQECTRESGVAAGCPAPRPPRPRPSWTSSILTVVWLRVAQSPTHLEFSPPNLTAQSGKLKQPNPRPPPWPTVLPLRPCRFCPTQSRL